MKKSLTFLFAVSSALIVATFIGVAFAQNVNTQTPTVSINSQVPPCVYASIGANVPPCWSNSTNSGYCDTNQYCQTQGCIGIGTNNKAQIGYGCGLGMTRRCL